MSNREPMADTHGPIRTVLWQRLITPGSEWCRLEQGAEGWWLRGIVVAEVASAPVLVDYSVGLDADWSTRSVEIVMRRGITIVPRTLRLTVDAEQRWQMTREP